MKIVILLVLIVFLNISRLFKQLDPDIKKNLYDPVNNMNLFIKVVKDLNVRLETIKKNSTENLGSKISDISWSNRFFDISPQAEETKGK